MMSVTLVMILKLKSNRMTIFDLDDAIQFIIACRFMSFFSETWGQVVFYMDFLWKSTLKT